MISDFFTFHFSIDLRRMMWYLKLILLLFATALTLVHSNEEEEDILKGINNYRESLNLPPLAKNDRAGCLADEIAQRLRSQPCSSSTYGINLVPGTGPQSTEYPHLLSKCDIGINHTGDGVILPACVEGSVPPSILVANYTQTQYTRYLNDSNYTGAGVGLEGGWTVVVLSTDSPGGSFAKAGGGRASAGGWSWVVLIMLTLLY